MVRTPLAIRSPNHRQIAAPSIAVVAGAFRGGRFGVRQPAASSLVGRSDLPTQTAIGFFSCTGDRTMLGHASLCRIPPGCRIPSPDLPPRFSPVYYSLSVNCFILNHLRTLRSKTPGVAHPIRHRSRSVTLEIRCNTISTQLNLERKAPPSHDSINRERSRGKQEGRL